MYLSISVYISAFFITNLKQVLTRERCYTKHASRKKSTFIPDELVPEAFRCTDEDYIYSGYDRGHLAAAGNHFNSQPAMDDTFLFTNICPQVNMPCTSVVSWVHYKCFIYSTGGT